MLHGVFRYGWWLLPVWLLPAAALMAYEAPWLWQTDLAVGYDDNPGNSGYSGDRRSDRFIEAGAGVNRLWRPGVLFSTELEAAVRSRQYQDYQRLSQVSPEILGRLNYRYPGGFFVPTVTGWAGATYLGYSSELREGSVTRIGVSLRQPLTTRLSLWGSATDARRRADNDVFSYGFHTFGLQLGWQPVTALTVHVGYSRREGDFVSINTDDPRIEDASRAWTTDDAIGGAGNEYLAYRLNAPSDRYVLGLGYDLTSAWSLRAQAEYIDTRAYRISYQRNIIRIGLSRSFP